MHTYLFAQAKFFTKVLNTKPLCLIRVQPNKQPKVFNIVKLRQAEKPVKSLLNVKI